MNISNRVTWYAGILTIVVTIFSMVKARVLPDVMTDRDLKAWHQFGLRSFYGPWGVVDRKPNGDLVSYADYGSPIPPNFQPMSTIGNDTLSEEQPDPYPPEAFADPSIFLDLPGFDSQRNVTDEGSRSNGSSSLDDLSARNTRNTLELIGIVGVVENIENISSNEESVGENYGRSTVADSSTDLNR